MDRDKFFFKNFPFFREKTKLQFRWEIYNLIFQYRVRPEATEFTSRPWTVTALTSLAAPGVFKQEIKGLEPGQRYQFQAPIKHPLLTPTAKEVALTVPAN